MRSPYHASFHDHEIEYVAEPAGRRLRWGRRVTVHEWEQGLLFRDGKLVDVLDAGSRRYWQQRLFLRRIDVRPWVLLVPTQEVPTADGATVKVSVAGRVKVVDPAAFVRGSRSPVEEVYLAVQLTLRELLASLSLDDLLAGRADLGERLLAGLGDLPDVGLAVEHLDVKDVVLPRELKSAQAEVLVARAQGLAALERARGETAALRSLANAARMAADNPAILQLRLLQQLESSSGHTVVIGSAPVFGAAAERPVSEE